VPRGGEAEESGARTYFRAFFLVRERRCRWLARLVEIYCAVTLHARTRPLLKKKAEEEGRSRCTGETRVASRCAHSPRSSSSKPPKIPRSLIAGGAEVRAESQGGNKMSPCRTWRCPTRAALPIGAACRRASRVTSSLSQRHAFLNLPLSTPAGPPHPWPFKSGSINIYIAPLPAFSDPDPHFSDNGGPPAGSSERFHAPRS